MRFIRAGVLATGTLFALSALASLALPHPAFAAIHLGDPNTVSLTNGLVGYWPFDGQVTSWTSNTTRDISGNGNTGSFVALSTTTSPVAGEIGHALKFNGISSNVSVNSNLGFTNRFTFAAWVRFNDLTDWQTLIGQDTSSWSGGNATFYLQKSGNGPNCGRLADTLGIALGIDALSCPVTAYSNTSVVTGRWYHAVGTYDGATLKFYQDGVLASSTATAITMGSQVAPLLIGAGYYANSKVDFVNGLIDDVRVYNRALTAGEVAQLYHLGTANAGHSNTVISNGLVGYWTFDGGQTHWNTNTTDDVSGNGNTGTLVSLATSTSRVAGKIGQALKFDGVNTCVTTSKNINNSQFTFTGWVYAKSAADRIGFFGQNDVAEFGFLDSSTFSLYTSFTNTLTAPMISFNTWHFVAAVGGSAGTFMYLDGVKVASADGTTDYGSSIYNFNIGGCGIWDYTGNNFNGYIDDVRIYNRALSAGEVQQLYHAGAANAGHSDAIISNGLVGYWPFDGGSTHWNTNTTDDVSGNGNTGTLVSLATSTSRVAGKIGQALKFDGSSSYASIQDNSSLKPAAVTVSAWVKLNSLTNSIVVLHQTRSPTSFLNEIREPITSRGTR